MACTPACVANSDPAALGDARPWPASSPSVVCVQSEAELAVALVARAAGDWAFRLALVKDSCEAPLGSVRVVSIGEPVDIDAVKAEIDAYRQPSMLCGS